MCVGIIPQAAAVRSQVPEAAAAAAVAISSSSSGGGGGRSAHLRPKPPQKPCGKPAEKSGPPSPPDTDTPLTSATGDQFSCFKNNKLKKLTQNYIFFCVKEGPRFGSSAAVAEVKKLKSEITHRYRER